MRRAANHSRHGRRHTHSQLGMQGSLKNVAENQCLNQLRSAGWNVTKRGWPDFWCWKPTGEILLVEVKPDERHPLKPEQRMVMNNLAELGITCRRWDPVNGLTEDLDEHLKIRRGGTEPKRHVPSDNYSRAINTPPSKREQRRMRWDGTTGKYVNAEGA